MASFRDLLTQGEKILTDVTGGAWASAANDLGDGLKIVGSLMTDLFGFRSAPGDATAWEVAAFLNRAHTVTSAPRASLTASFDPDKIMAALQLFLQAFASIWNLFHSTEPAPAVPSILPAA